MLVCKKEVSNYHLRLKIKWSEKIFSPRLSMGKDSGLLHYSFGQHGADYWRSWMFGHEFQANESRTGEYWTIGLYSHGY
jgi:hypothetical protein